MNPFLTLTIVSLLTAALSLAVLALVRKRNWHDIMEPHNDAIGFVYSAIAVLYAVVLGFSLIAVWERYDAAQAVVEAEANAITNLLILTETLPEDQGAVIRPMITGYVVSVVENEWPAQQDGELPHPTSRDGVLAIWSWYMNADPGLWANETLYDTSIETLVELEDSRRSRIQTARGGIGDFILAILIVAAIPTVLGPCLLGVKNPRVHQVIVAGAGVSIAFMVGSVFLLNGPFIGSVKIEPEAFERLLELSKFLS